MSSETQQYSTAVEGKQGRTLHGNLGVLAIAFMVIAFAAPLGAIAANNPLGFMLGNGAGFPMAYVIIGIILMLFSIGLGTMSKYIEKPGAFFSYVSNGLGRVAGASAAYVSLVFYSFLQIGVFCYLGYELSILLSSFGIKHVPWAVLAFVFIAINGWLTYRNIDMSMKVLTFLLSGEVLVFLVLAIAVLVQGGAQGLDFGSFSPKNVTSGNLGLGLMFAAVSFIGFESTAIYRSEAREPDKTVPKATYVAVIAVSIFYLFSAWVLVEAWGSSEIVDAATKHAGDFLQLTAQHYIGGWYAIVLNIFIVSSVFACALSVQNVVNRYYHSLGNAHLMPAWFGKVHEKYDAPSRGALFNTIVIAAITLFTVVAGWDPYTQTYTWFSAVGVLGFFLLLAATCLSVVAYFFRRWAAAGIWRTLIIPGLGFIGTIVIFVIVLQNFPMVDGDVDAKGNPQYGPLTFSLMGIIAAAIVAGIVVAAVMHKKHPDFYENLISPIDKAAKDKIGVNN